jgi:adenylate cyclase, class 2
MPRPPSRLETEIKLRIGSAADTRSLLRNQGFRIAKRRVFESNTIFDTPDLALRRKGTLLRLRQAGRRHILTFKGPLLAGEYKSRAEFESEFTDRDALVAILRHLGYAPVFRYEKYRTEYAKPGEAGITMLDETPIGAFLELEGPPRWIDRTARQLGYPPAAYITASYGYLYFAHCQSKGLTPRHMVFSVRS